MYMNSESSDGIELSPLWSSIRPNPSSSLIPYDSQAKPIVVDTIDGINKNVTYAEVLDSIGVTDDEAKFYARRFQELTAQLASILLSENSGLDNRRLIDKLNQIMEDRQKSSNDSQSFAETSTVTMSKPLEEPLPEVAASSQVSSKPTAARALSDTPNMLTIKFLQDELRLDDTTLSSILLKHSWILYLRVDTNLRPKVAMLRSRGFSKNDIRTIVKAAPSVLGINLEWTLPEKLLTIQKLFHLSRRDLLKVVTSAPWLLTCSIERNTEVAKYLNFLGFEDKMLKRMVINDPGVLNVGVDGMRSVYSLLTEVFGLPRSKAKHVIHRFPRILKRVDLARGQERLDYLREEFGLIPPFEDLQKVIERFPMILYKDIDSYLRPTVAIMRKYLELSNADLRKIIILFPQLLGYNLEYVEIKCKEVMFFLTSDPIYRTLPSALKPQVTSVKDDEDFDGPSYDVLASCAMTKPLSLADDIRACLLLTSSLSIDKQSALYLVHKTPWLLGFRMERTRGMIFALALTLGMTREECQRVLTICPRIVTVNVDGKLQQLMQVLAQLAMTYLHSPDQKANVEALLRDLNDSDGDAFEYLRPVSGIITDSLKQRRRDPIRSLIRFLILRNPLLICTAIARIDQRVAEIMQVDAYDRPKPTIPWNKLPNQIRRNPSGHIRWQLKQEKQKVVDAWQEKETKQLTRKQVQSSRSTAETVTSETTRILVS
jgi:hypothetical protein